MFNYSRWILTPLAGICVGLAFASFRLNQSTSVTDKIAQRRGFRDAKDETLTENFLRHIKLGPVTKSDPEGLSIFSTVIKSGTERAVATVIIHAGMISEPGQQRLIFGQVKGLLGKKAYQEPASMMLRKWASWPTGKKNVEAFGRTGDDDVKAVVRLALGTN